jgi:hypothetical protein
MKDRSGRSYDALARRAGISSSALHRYCSGRTVPTDFQVIERFGRVCRLDRAELLELHRRWAVAVAAREDAAAPVQQETPTPPVPRPGAANPPAQLDQTNPANSVEPANFPQQTGEAKPVKPVKPMEPVEPVDPAGEVEPAGRVWRRPGLARVGLAVLGVAVGGVVGWVWRSALHRTLALALVGAVAVALAGWAATRPAAVPPAGPGPTDGRMLFSAACTDSVHMGQHDECVREVQRLLAATGAKLGIDADFGPETLRTVTAFQVLAGVEANGVVGDTTKRALYAGTVSMRSWDPARVERRIRQVFPEEPDRALRIARCQSFLDPFYVLPNTNGTRNWGVFLIADFLLRRYGGTPRRAFDPEWNIQTARRIWADDGGFRNWPHCDPEATASPSARAPGPAGR